MQPRTTRVVLLGALVLLCAAVAVWMAGNDLDTNDRIASVTAMAFAAVGLAVGIISATEPREHRHRDVDGLADDLAGTVADEWAEEATARRLRDPHVLPVAWSSEWLTGRVDGPFDEVAARVARGYSGIGSGRMLVLGEPGSGKTVLAIVLTLGLLADRSPGAPVPVLLAASSWDPVEESLDDWSVRAMATAYYNGRTEIPRRLLDHGKVRLVLDGLDEIPEADRRAAVRGIDTALGRDRPVVVTCRAAEYAEVIRDGSPGLRGAVVTRVLPVAAEDASAYLREASTADWAPVFAAVGDDPGGDVALALSTPLMVSLARTVFQRLEADPTDLLDRDRFPSRHAVEDFLVDHLVDATYAAQGTRAEAAARRSAHAKRSLEFLARYMHRYRRRDLAWWRISDRLLSPWAAPVIGLGIGLCVLVLLSIGVGVGVLRSDTGTMSQDLPLRAAMVIAVLATALWYGAAYRVPGRVAFSPQGWGPRFRAGFRTGAAFVAVPAVPLLLGGPILSSLEYGSLTYRVADLADLLAAAVMVVVAGTAFGAHQAVNALPRRSARSSPMELLRQDRRSVLVGGVVATAVTVLVAVPALRLGVILETVYGGALSGIGPDNGVLLTEQHYHYVDPTTAVVVMAVAVAVLVTLTRAWPRFAVTRLVLAARRKTPLRLMRFLAEARNLGLLRQSGGVYQFRHVRLQERLQGGPTESREPGRAMSPQRRKVVVLASILALVAGTVVTIGTYNYLRCEPLLQLGGDVSKVRASTDTGSTCIGVVPESQWYGLPADHEVLDRLIAGNRHARDLGGAGVVGVIGSLRTGDGGSWRELSAGLLGVAEAQEQAPPDRPVRVVLVGYPNEVPDAQYTAVGRVAVAARREGAPLLGVVDLTSTWTTPLPDDLPGTSAAIVHAGGGDERYAPSQVQLLRLRAVLAGDQPDLVDPRTLTFGCDGTAPRLLIRTSTALSPLEPGCGAQRPTVVVGGGDPESISDLPAVEDGDVAYLAQAPDVACRCDIPATRRAHDLTRALAGEPGLRLSKGVRTGGRWEFTALG
ncbi:NACHT domain-containing protein [Actinokineospora cianjurensis]|uniref:NACHT domain-containing protein n=1 Tax=Actinokineospora cianjurensis TaxID=585224 RepID=A0A421BCD0_9PSEU|nr:NACHT domain-containing protein [Actinokineospora cianjurensis]RLK62034.1 NACHT domain-containing protein [Actinokineospora cianjurensis]